jgi:predicted nucleic acid-binding Zn ribbon protein
MSTHPKVTCPKCGREAEHVFESSGIVFKGSGFYNTDQRSK